MACLRLRYRVASLHVFTANDAVLLILQMNSVLARLVVYLRPCR